MKRAWLGLGRLKAWKFKLRQLIMELSTIIFTAIKLASAKRRRKRKPSTRENKVFPEFSLSMNAVMEGSREHVYHGIWLNTRSLVLGNICFPDTSILIRDSSLWTKWITSVSGRDPWGESRNDRSNKWRQGTWPSTFHSQCQHCQGQLLGESRIW